MVSQIFPKIYKLFWCTSYIGSQLFGVIFFQIWSDEIDISNSHLRTCIGEDNFEKLSKMYRDDQPDGDLRKKGLSQWNLLKKSMAFKLSIRSLICDHGVICIL